MRRLLFFLPLFAAACGTSEPKVSHDRVVIASKKPTGKPKQPPEWFDREIDAAAEDLREGRLEQGLERVLHARDQNPAGRDAADLEDLLARFNRAVLDLPTLLASVEPEHDPIAFGDPVLVRVRLENPGTRTVRVRAQAKKSSKSVFVLDLTRTDYDVRAHVVTTMRQLHVPLEKDLELPPKATTDVLITVAGAGNDDPLEGFRTFTVGGHLRAGVIELDKLRRYEAVRVRPGTLRSFRPNYEHLAADPVARMKQAFERNAPLHLLTASALVPAEGRQEAVDTLVGALQGGGPMDFAAFACLEYLTNAEIGCDADAWRAWWPRVREHYFVVGEGPPGEGAAPRFSEENR